MTSLPRRRLVTSAIQTPACQFDCPWWQWEPPPCAVGHAKGRALACRLLLQAIAARARGGATTRCICPATQDAGSGPSAQ
eukprot:354169-Chlamydomonas_euryale.AAC.10